MKLGTWIVTALAFPIGGYLALALLGPATDLAAAALGGAIVGAALGAAQWWVLRRTGIRPSLVAVTAAAVAVGNALAFATLGAAPVGMAQGVAGAIAGAVVGAAQSMVILRQPTARFAWAGAMSVVWAVGRLTTAAIGVDAATASHSFGASGAIVVTLVTGFLLRALLARGTAGTSGASVPRVRRPSPVTRAAASA